MTTFETLCLRSSLCVGTQVWELPRQASTQIRVGHLTFPRPAEDLSSTLGSVFAELCLRTTTSPLVPHVCLCHMTCQEASLPTPLWDLATGYCWTRGNVSRDAGMPLSSVSNVSDSAGSFPLPKYRTQGSCQHVSWARSKEFMLTLVSPWDLGLFLSLKQI